MMSRRLDFMSGCLDIMWPKFQQQPGRCLDYSRCVKCEDPIRSSHQSALSSSKLASKSRDHVNAANHMTVLHFQTTWRHSLSTDHGICTDLIGYYTSKEMLLSDWFRACLIGFKDMSISWCHVFFPTDLVFLMSQTLNTLH